MRAKPAEFCEGRSKCGARRIAEKHAPHLTITEIVAADVDPANRWAVGAHKVVTVGSWHGPISFCPFCGRPLSWAAGWKARLSGRDKRRPVRVPE